MYVKFILSTDTLLLLTAVSVAHESVSLVVSRQILTELCGHLENVNQMTAKAVSHFTLEKLQPRVISFEEQVCLTFALPMYISWSIITVMPHKRILIYHLHSDSHQNFLSISIFLGVFFLPFYRGRGATLKVGGLTSDSKWGGWKYLFPCNSLKFPKKWGGWNPPPPAPPPPRALFQQVPVFQDFFVHSFQFFVLRP